MISLDLWQNWMKLKMAVICNHVFYLNELKKSVYYTNISKCYIYLKSKKNDFS